MGVLAISSKQSVSLDTLVKELRVLEEQLRTIPKRIREIRRTLSDELGYNENRLTERLQEVLELVRMDLCNKEIGVRLSISERTVKFHVARLFVIYNVKNRKELMI